jgi:hypothetical protein
MLKGIGCFNFLEYIDGQVNENAIIGDLAGTFISD